MTEKFESIVAGAEAKRRELRGYRRGFLHGIAVALTCGVVGALIAWVLIG